MTELGLRTADTVDRLLRRLGSATLGSAARAALIAMSDLTVATLASKPRLRRQ